MDALLRPVFLCLDFEATAKSQAFTAQLLITKAELLAGGHPRTYDQRLIEKKQADYLIDNNDNVIPSRFEWLLYLQIPNKLKGQLHLPGIIRYRALQDDLVSNARWKTKKKLLSQSMLPRMNGKPNQLIKTLSSEL